MQTFFRIHLRRLRAVFQKSLLFQYQAQRRFSFVTRVSTFRLYTRQELAQKELVAPVAAVGAVQTGTDMLIAVFCLGRALGLGFLSPDLRLVAANLSRTCAVQETCRQFLR